MSLDVYLTLAGAEPREGSGIFLRENGQNREVTRAEWDARFPDREPIVAKVTDCEEPTEVYSANITHNLGRMAGEAGIYEALWRPEEIGVTKARDLVPLLRAGLAKLLAEPERFAPFNPSNGWGSYDGLVSFVSEYLAACEADPMADVRVSR